MLDIFLSGFIVGLFVILIWGIVYGTGDHRRSRIDAIRERLVAINPDVTVSTAAPTHAVPLDPVAANNLAEALVAGGLAASRALAQLIRGDA